MADTVPPENDSILTTETAQITIAEERFDRVYLVICLNLVNCELKIQLRTGLYSLELSL